MARKPTSVTESELAVLEVLWSKGPSTIRQLTEILYTKGTAGEYATVQKLLDRLRTKGCVKRSKNGLAHTFTAKVSRTELIGRGLETLAGKLCSGSMTPLLIHLTESVKLSREDRETLRQLIDQN